MSTVPGWRRFEDIEGVRTVTRKERGKKWEETEERVGNKKNPMRI